MPKIELPIKNFANQQLIFDNPARYVIVAKGRRFGLTKGAANDFIKRGLNGSFKRGLWVDTVNANIERYVERYFLPALNKLPQNLWSWRKQQKILKIRDAYIDFRSVDNPENIEGFSYDKFFLNEAGIILKDPYLWDNAILPMLWDTEAKGVIGGAPKGKGIFFEMAARGQDPDQKEYAFYRFTPFDNPYIKPEKIRDDMKNMPDRVIQQEIYAQFLEDTGVVFRNVKDIATLTSQDPIEGHLYVMGCDLAKVQDYTVLTVYDRKTNHQVCQMRFNKLDYTYQKEKIKYLCLKYNRALIELDSTGVGEPIFDDLSRAGLPVESVRFTNELKKQLVEKLANWIEMKDIFMLNLKETIDEFNIFTYDYSEKTGRVIYNAPLGFHDDIVMSHALAIWALNPIIKSEVKPQMSIIAKDLHEKKNAINTDEEGYEYESYQI